jgi:hypothetical protein
MPTGRARRAEHALGVHRDRVHPALEGNQTGDRIRLPEPAQCPSLRAAFVAQDVPTGTLIWRVRQARAAALQP